MTYVALGILGFAVGFMFDLVSLRPVRGVRPVLLLLYSSLVGFSILMLCLESDKLGWPAWTGWLGASGLVAFTGLEVYSLFINLPFNDTYLANRGRPQLVKTGMYALVRHPGVLWWSLTVVSLVLVSGSRLLLLTSPLWIGLDVVWVVMQEKFVFVKLFEGYGDYQRETPMLFPSWRSTKTCLNSIRHVRREKGDARGS